MWDCFTAPGGGWSLAVVAAAAHPPAEGHAGGPTPGGQRAHSEDASEGPLQHCEAADPDTQCWGPPTTTGWASQRCLNVSYTKKKQPNKGRRSSVKMADRHCAFFVLFLKDFAG